MPQVVPYRELLQGLLLAALLVLLLVAAGIDHFDEADAPIGHYIRDYFMDSDIISEEIAGQVAEWMCGGENDRGEKQEKYSSVLGRTLPGFFHKGKNFRT